MKSIVEEKLVSFKTLEQKVFRYVCELAQEITRILLENYDAELAEGRDKSQYRDKGKRTTTIKTVYGEVSYARRVYQTNLEDGRKACVYLLDEAMHMDKIGLLSTNLAEKIAMTVTESPYRVTAEIISETCGQSISHGGAWNLVQRLGERIREEEDHAVKQMEAGQAEGRESLPVLFEEMDGVWLSMQDKDHKKMKKQEMKVFTMYEGWDGSSRQRSRLVNKTMMAGMEKSDEFHRKREALIEKKYNADEIQQRILNGDGGSWIKEPYDPEVIFQLDRFHIYQEIKRKLKEKEAQKAVTELFEAGKIDEMLEYIREDDTVYVEEFSRLGRSTADLLATVKQIEDTGAKFISLKEKFDTHTPAGKLQMTMMAAIAEFERSMILERQREGIAIAKREGKYKGRKAVSVPNIGEYYQKYMSRQATKTSIAEELGISRTTLDKLFKEHEQKLSDKN